MRKNGVNRELHAIEGGVCAPEGFKAGGLACGIKANGENDLALILADKRSPIACVYTSAPKCGAPVTVTKKHVKSGYGRAVIANGGIANVFLPRGERLAVDICGLVEKYCNVIREEVAIASTGEVGKALCFETFVEGVKTLSESIAADEAGSLAAAQAIASPHVKPQHFAYSFEIGDFTCKMGGICKGSTHVSPNMATTLLFLTTDVHITPEMLQRALKGEVKETLNLLNIDGEPSPNDTVCIIANGRAGNSLIDCVDSEYQKFAFALRSVLIEVCRKIAAGPEQERKVFSCKISGTKSKQVARAFVRAVVGSPALREACKRGELDVESVMYLLIEKGALADFSDVSLSLRSEKGKIVLFENGKKFAGCGEHVKRILSGKDILVGIELREGNYGATAYGCF